MPDAADDEKIMIITMPLSPGPLDLARHANKKESKSGTECCNVDTRAIFTQL